MKLLFDFRAYQEFYPRGVSRYVYELFSRAIYLNHGENGVLVDFDKRLPEFPSNIKAKIKYYNIKNAELHNDGFDFFVNGSTTWLGRPQYDSLEVLYPPEVLKKVKQKVCILYDFVPLLYPHYLPTERDQINYFLQCEAAKYMDHIFTISQYISESGSHYLKRPPSDFTCLYGGADKNKFRSDNSDLPYDPNIRTHDLVNVSGVCVRKNFVGVTKAFCKAYTSGKIPKDARLVIICGSADFFLEAIKKEVEDTGLLFGKHVLSTGYISDREMLKYISNAFCSIYPSLYEGLGLPILESYTSGTPCIASNVSSMKELVLKEASFDPFDIIDMEKKIIEVYCDVELCKKSLDFGRELIKKINWDNSAQILLDKLEDLN